MQPTKWDSEAKSLGKRLSKREKLALLQFYGLQMRQGRNREEILDELADKIGVTSQRQVERILAQAKEYQQEIEHHRTELSHAALAIACNLKTYREPLICWKNPDQIGELVYGGTMYKILPSPLNSGQVVQLEKVDENMALNLLAHLQQEFPELASIDDWVDLADCKITEDFIQRLNLKGYRGDFNGKCKDCPS